MTRRKANGIYDDEIGLLFSITFHGIRQPASLSKDILKCLRDSFPSARVSDSGYRNGIINVSCQDGSGEFNRCDIDSLREDDLHSTYSVSIDTSCPVVLVHLSTPGTNGIMRTPINLDIRVYGQALRQLDKRGSASDFADTIFNACDRHGDVHCGSATVDIGYRLAHMTLYSEYRITDSYRSCDQNIRIANNVLALADYDMRAMPIAWANLLGPKLLDQLPKDIVERFKNIEMDDGISVGDQFVKEYTKSKAFFLSKDPMMNCGKKYFPCYEEPNTYFEVGLWLAREYSKARIG